MTILSLTRSPPLAVSESVSRKSHHISLASLSKLDAMARQQRRVTSRLLPICILFVLMRHCKRHIVYVPATSHVPNQLFHIQSAARMCQCRRLVAMRDGLSGFGPQSISSASNEVLSSLACVPDRLAAKFDPWSLLP
jgi:hypothetical protein